MDVSDGFWSPEAVTGVRLFSVRASTAGWALSAMSMQATYEPAVRAVCMAGGRHVVPAPDCACGFYLCPDLDRLSGAVGSMQGLPLVEAAGWGRVIEHELAAGEVGGWRTEFLEVRAVRFSDRCWCGARAAGIAAMSAPAAAGRVLPWCEPCAARYDADLVDPAAAAAMLDAVVTIDVDDPRLWFNDAQRAVVRGLWLRRAPWTDEAKLSR